CALDVIGATFIREVENGEIIVITENGIESHKPFPPRPAQPCIFEYIYFARPDSIVGGRSVYELRKAMGAQLAREAPADVDIVVPIPDSGVPAALGFANEAGLPFEYGIIRNNYVGRTFIETAQQIRQLGVKLKHSANRAVIENKRIVLIDDSVVRGTTSQKLVNMMLAAGAREVHMRIACPEIKYSDHYGIDTPRTEELLASSRSVEEMREYMGAASLAFLTVDGLYAAMGCGPRNPAIPQFTDHCFTGDYPTALTDLERAAGGRESRQLSLLAEAR
ncbi:MAG: amidophosphoribosyltransferase, partial [Pseudomonadota bacterium]